MKKNLGTTIWATVLAVGLGAFLPTTSSAQNRTWTGRQSSGLVQNLWGQGNNWSGSAVPGAGTTAYFTSTTKTTVGFGANASIGGITFDAIAKPYTFNVINLVGTSTFSITGVGITNSSTNVQTFNTSSSDKIVFSGTATAGTNTVFNNVGLGATNFTEGSNAGSATINNYSSLLSLGVPGSTTFSGSSSAANATINNYSLGSTTFNGNATAGQAVINTGSAGFLTFNDNASGGNATLNNTLGGVLTFNDDSSAGAATISNTLASFTTFNDNSNAGSAVISSSLGGFVTFNDSSNAGTATINSGTLGLVTFNDFASSGSATLNNSLGGLATFNDETTAGASTINNSLLGATTFNEGSSAGAATINSGSLGFVTFTGSSNAGTAIINNSQGGVATFNDNSTASGSTITNSLLGATLFNGNSSAGAATISNNLGGLTTFSGSSTAHKSVITSGTLGFLVFSDNATAGRATIENIQGGVTTFSGSSYGAGATITNSQLGATLFTAATSSGSATITNTQLGFTIFSENSDAGTSNIANNQIGGTLFSGSSSAAGSTIDNSLLGATIFSENSTAGSATITNSLAGATLFLDNSNAGTATINSGTLGGVVFTGSSSASQATIGNSQGALALFMEDATAGDSTITNSLLGLTVFNDRSTASGAHITNTLAGFTTFTGDSTAGHALIENTLGGFTTFDDNASAGSATINTGTLAFTTFNDNSTADSATLNNTLGGFVVFNDSSTAGSSTITNNLLAGAIFNDNASAGSAHLDNSLGGFTIFNDESTAATATIFNTELGFTVFNDSTTAGSATLDNTLGGFTIFNDDSTASAAAITNSELAFTIFNDRTTADSATLDNSLGGFTIFNDETTAGTATITNSLLGFTIFNDTTTSGGASISNTAGGFTLFNDDSVASPDTTITNSLLGGTIFAGNSNSNGATINNLLGGFTVFKDNAQSDPTVINNFLGGATFYQDDSSAVDARINNFLGGLTVFSDNATADVARIRNTALGLTVFTGNATAGDAVIRNQFGGATWFAGESSAGTSRIVNNFLGATVFTGSSTADEAVVRNRFGAVVDVSGHEHGLSIGSLGGRGNVYLGGTELTLGGLDRNDRISGVIQDGGLFGGTGGSIVKIGSGTLTLTQANSYSGGTTIDEGRVRTRNAWALGTGSVTLNGGVLDMVGDLNVGNDFNFNGGSVATYIDNSSEVVRVTNWFRDGGGQDFIISTTQNTLSNTAYTLVTFEKTTYADASAFTATSVNPNVILDYVFDFDVENELRLTLKGASAKGEILQNSDPVDVPTFADFIVDGPVRTGSPLEDNTIRSLIFRNNSSLRVFNNLFVTLGNLDVPNGTATLFGDNVITPGDFSKTGLGKLFTNIDIFVNGVAKVLQGTLSVNRNLTATGGLTIFQNAILGGNGVIHGNVTNYGQVSPGNSIGILTFNGNYVAASNSSFLLEIASLSSFDQLIVTGNASLAGVLQVSAGRLKYGQQYAFLHANSITGAFDSVQMLNNASTYRGRFLVEGGTGILLVAPTSYTLVADTINQQNVARALDSYIPATGGDRFTVSLALDLLTAEQYPNAFDQIAPTFYESLANITIEQAVAQNQILAQRMSAARLGARGFSAVGLQSPLVHDKDGKSVLDAKDAKAGKDIITTTETKWGVWAQGNGIFSRVTNANQVPSYNFNGGGFTVGADYRWSENFLTGVYVGYEGIYSKYNGGGTTTVNSALFGGYATYQNGGFYADGIIGGGYNGYNVKRPINFSTVDRTARSQPNGGQFTTYLDMGYDWQLGNFTLGPIVGGQYTYAGIAPFTENGADSLDLRVAQQNANSLRTFLGGRIAYTWNVTPTIAIIPEVRLFWQHEFLNNPRNIGAALDGGSGPTFGYQTSTPDRDSVFAGGGVSAQFGRNWNAYFYYNADFGRQDYVGHVISTGLNWQF